MDAKRANNKEPRTTQGKRQKIEDEKATEHPPAKNNGKQMSSSIPAPSSNTTRRPFFGVIDNVSSFSGIIEGPYDFGFAISITVDRQTFKGVVYKSNPDHNPESAFPDEEVMINFAATAQAPAHGRGVASKSKPHAQPLTGSEEVRLPDITTFHFQDGRHSVHEPPRTPHDSPRTPLTPHTPHTPHDIPRTPLSSHDSPSPKDDGHSDADEHHPHYQQSPSFSHHDDSLPAIHSVLRGIDANTFSPPPASQSHHSSAPTPVASPPPLPPQPQLQRQKQRQKKRQEKKLMELQQQQPARYQSLLDREKSKIPLLGDESLVSAGMEILQHMGDHKH